MKSWPDSYCSMFIWHIWKVLANLKKLHFSANEPRRAKPGSQWHLLSLSLSNGLCPGFFRILRCVTRIDFSYSLNSFLSRSGIVKSLKNVFRSDDGGTLGPLGTLLKEASEKFNRLAGDVESLTSRVGSLENRHQFHCESSWTDIGAETTTITFSTWDLAHFRYLTQYSSFRKLLTNRYHFSLQQFRLISDVHGSSEGRFNEPGRRLGGLVLVQFPKYYRCRYP